MESEELENSSNLNEVQEEEGKFQIPGVIRAEVDVSLADTAAAAVIAGRDVEMTDSLSGAVVTGANLKMTDSFGKVIVAGGSVEIHDGGVGVMHCKQAAVESGTIGVLFAPQASLGENVRVVMTGRQAALLGAAFGLVAGLMGLIFCKKR